MKSDTIQCKWSSIKFSQCFLYAIYRIFYKESLPLSSITYWTYKCRSYNCHFTLLLKTTPFLGDFSYSVYRPLDLWCHFDYCLAKQYHTKYDKFAKNSKSKSLFADVIRQIRQRRIVWKKRDIISLLWFELDMSCNLLYVNATVWHQLVSSTNKGSL